MDDYPNRYKNGSPNSLLGVILAASLSRTVINTSRRFMYPFAPVISRGLGVPLTAITSVIAVNQATSVLGLVASHIGDRTGYKRMMLAGLFLLISGMAIAGAFPVYYTLVIAMFFAGLGKTLFDPAIQAYVSKRVPYKRRGLVIGIMEISWAGSTLAGIPLAGLMIDAFGWRSPFFAIAGAGIFCLVIVVMYMRSDSEKPGQLNDNLRFFSALVSLLKNPRALGAVGFGFFVSFANDNLFVIYGAWLENSFQMSVVALGLGTSVIGVAELLGEILTATGSDRVGLKASVIFGGVLSSVAYLMIPIVGQSMIGAFSGLFILFFFFEFSMVSFISMCTELVPKARATMMALFFLAAGLGRGVGAFTGGFGWHASGIEAVCLLSCVFNTLALLCLIWGTRRWSPGA